MKENVILQIKNLRIWYEKKSSPVYLINGIDLTLYANEILGLVGESGSGKSLTAFSILHLLPGNLRMEYDEFLFDGRQFKSLEEFEKSNLRGNRITMIFQDPLSALNPLLKIRAQLEEILEEHTDLNKQERLQKIIETLKNLDFPDPEDRLNQYPHQLSGGLRQRILIAMALLTSPKIVIADEPTTALDVTTQSKSLKLMLKMKQKLNNSILFISHDLYLLKQIADRIYVMYAGEILETGPAEDLFKHPRHPYTKGLIDSIPIPRKKKKIFPIQGMIPSPEERPSGCVFSNRCPYKDEQCEKEKPSWSFSNERGVRCFHPLG